MPRFDVNYQLSDEELGDVLEQAVANYLNQGGGPSKEPDPEFVPGGAGSTNASLLTEEFYDPFGLFEGIADTVERALVSVGNQMGQPPTVMQSFFQTHLNDMVQTVQDRLVHAQIQDRNIRNLMGDRFNEDVADVDFSTIRGTSSWFGTVDGINDLVSSAWGVYRQAWPDLPASFMPSGGGGRGGPRKPTPTEIRNRFDLDQLAEGVQDMWRGMLLTEHDDPRGLASEYVEAVVATAGEKTIDFASFVRQRARQTPRHASIYRNKPKSLSEEAYIQPYFQSAQQVLRPRNAAAAAIGGAQFGASGGVFADRLRRSNENRTSSNFIAGLEARMQDVSEVLRG